MDKIAGCFASIKIEWMHIILLVSVIGAVWLLWNIQRAANGIKLEKLILEENGDPSWTKMSGIGAWFIATYVVVHSELSGKVVDGMIVLLLIYAGIYTLNRTATWALARIWPGGGPPPSLQQDIRVSAPADANVNIQTGDKSQ